MFTAKHYLFHVYIKLPFGICSDLKMSELVASEGFEPSFTAQRLVSFPLDENAAVREVLASRIVQQENVAG